MPLRIFVAVRHSFDRWQFCGSLWSDNFYPALRDLGHKIVESKVDLQPASRFMDIATSFTAEERETRDRITEQIVDEVKSAHSNAGIDLVLTYFYNSHFNPQGFAAIRRLGIRTVNFYCNSIHQFPLVAEIAPAVDVAWHPERDANASYIAAGANPVWVQMGADPGKYHPERGIARQNRSCFVGQRYADRDRLVAELIRREIPVDLYGDGWSRLAANAAEGRSQHSGENGATEYLGRKVCRPGSAAAYLRAARECLRRHGPLRGIARLAQRYRHAARSRQLLPLLGQHAKGRAEDISETFARYDVVLNFSNVWVDGTPGSALIPHVRLRDFEGPMSRACYITGHSDEIAEFYDVGHELDTYRSSKELGEKTKFYLSHPAAAESLREGGYQRAIRHHTWRCRFEELFRKIGLN
jgi:spore maturation protein CgeB